jgi:phenylalanyl-tRNA synthetase beta subunit
VKNPLSEDHTHLRPSIVPGLIATAALNLRQGAAQLRFFEAGRVFLALPKNNTREEERLAILLSGPVAPSSWHAREPQAADFYDLLGLIQNLVGPGVAIEPKAIDDTPGFLLTSELRQGNRNLGWIAQLHPARARAIDARHPVYVAELLPSALRQLQTGPAKFEELPRFPAISRDIALECPQNLTQAQILAALQKAKPALLHEHRPVRPVPRPHRPKARRRSQIPRLHPHLPRPRPHPRDRRSRYRPPSPAHRPGKSPPRDAQKVAITLRVMPRWCLGFSRSKQHAAEPPLF